MNPSNYFLPYGYKHSQDINATHDDNRTEFYWDEYRRGISKYYQLPVYQLAKKYSRKNSKIADIGSGPAYKLANIFRGHPNLFAYDQANAIKIVKNLYPHIKSYAVDFESLDIHSYEQADIVICADVIEHVTNPDLLLGFIQSILSSSGLLIISTPCRKRLRGKYSLSSPKKEHIREWSADEFICYLQSLGFCVKSHRFSMQFPFSLALLPLYAQEILNSFKNRTPLRLFSCSIVVAQRV